MHGISKAREGKVGERREGGTNRIPREGRNRRSSNTVILPTHQQSGRKEGGINLKK
jgi:hypothetical protein